jgi:hypothetical protein
MKIRKKIENIIREEREVNKKSLSITRKNKFPKEKVYQIWEKIKAERGKTIPCGLFIKPHIAFYWDYRRMLH